MLEPQASRFWQAALLSGLMDVEGLTACWNAITPAKRDAPEHIDRRLARQAVQLKFLTLWQAQQLLAGRTSGFRVDRYVLLDLIGQGGMGRVYLARDSRLNRQVALKILSPERINNPRAIARFQREARVGAQLQHENLVRIYDFGESNGRYYLVMEYIEGKTLGTLISEQGQMPPTTAVRLVRQVALGLEHAHRKGLIHRDVNPYNVLVTRDGTAKLADLGLAIDLADEDHVTREGATVGTFDYVAPEQARHSHAADIRSDIYSLGCTIYHMCAGQVPFPSPSLPEKLFAHQALEPTPLTKLVSGLPAGLGEVIQRMMRKAPDERYSTPIQVFTALEPYATESSIAGNRETRAATIEESLTAPDLPPAYEPRLGASRDQVAEPALVKTVAVFEGSEPPLTQTETETGSRAGAGEPEVSVRRYAPTADVSDPDFPLYVDLGPEPSLSEGLSRPKPKSKVDYAVLKDYAAQLRKRLAPFRLWGLLTLTITVMVMVVFLLVDPFGASTGGTAASLHVASDSKPNAKTNFKQPNTIQKAAPAIVVRNDGEIYEEFPTHKFFQAIQTAIGARGWVELRNREPLHLSADQKLDFSSGRGPLIIRAAPGIQPILETELKDAKPLLTTGSAVSLDLSGLTILVRYSQQSALSVPAALIASAGTVTLDRCAFKVIGTARPHGSRAIFCSGGAIKVNRCWFEGFDQATDVVTMNNAHAQIRQTMIVPAFGPEAQAQPSEWYGWGVKLQLGAAGATEPKNSPPHLTLDHCTLSAAGLIDLTGNKSTSPLRVEVNNCAVKAEALLACKPGAAPLSQVQWRGKGNQYDILGRSWIVLSARQGTPASVNAVTELKSWLLFAPGDSNPVADKLEFPINSSDRTEPAGPLDFSNQDPVAPQVRPGADPKLVGPWSR